MKRIYFLLLLFSTHLMFAQVKVKDTVTRKANISFTKKANQILFSPETPPLFQIAGAPKAYYSYFWETGDGNYNKTQNPKHIYRKKGNYKVNLSVTNNYDNGKPPKTRPKLVTINEIENQEFTEIAMLKDTIQFQLFNHREPVPDEEMIAVVSYKNPLNYVTSGLLYLFFNEKEFKNNNFDLIETRTHFDEKEVSEEIIVDRNETNNTFDNLASIETKFLKFDNINDEQNLEATLMKSKNEFRNMKCFRFENLNPYETRNMFFTFKTTPEMIKDTTATVKMRGVYVPDRNYKNHKKKDLEMEIVTSHDPNKMSSNATFMNYRTVKFKKIKFKTQFQNDGEGPARTIRLETDIPDMFDKKTLEILDLYPKCPICPKEKEVNYSCLDTIIKQKQIYFTFKNIYLPGTNQKNVTEKDSTKGFVKYSMKLAKDFHKKRTRSKTAIFFDKNEPVITNYAITRFKPGTSIGLKTGYNFFPQLNDSKSYFMALTISPFKSYRWYWQIEWQNNLHQYNTNTLINEEIVTSNNGVRRLVRKTSNSSFDNVTTEIPVLARYNINNNFGVGTGFLMGINLSEKRVTNLKTETFENTEPKNPINVFVEENRQKNNISTFKTGTFIEATGGFSRIGPSLGARYVFNFKKDFNYLQLYAIWKF